MVAFNRNFFEEAPSQMTAVDVAAYFGLEAAVNALLSRSNSQDPKDTDGRTPLLYEAEERRRRSSSCCLPRLGFYTRYRVSIRYRYDIDIVLKNRSRIDSA
jgi:ankyrin repeat protein